MYQIGLVVTVLAILWGLMLNPPGRTQIANAVAASETIYYQR